MIALGLALAIAIAPPATDAPHKRARVLVLDLKAVGISDGEAALLRDAMVSRLGKKENLEVISSAEVKTLVDIEAQKQAAGCDPAAASCIAELAGALGADYVVSGNVGKLGESVVLNVSLLEAKTAQAKARANVTGASLDDVLVALGPEIDELTASLGAPARAPGPLLYAGAGVGAVGAVGLVVGGFWTGALQGTLGDPAGKPDAKASALEQRPFALGTLAAGVVIAAAGAALLVVALGAEEQP